MLLPDSYISKKEYLEQYKIQPVKVYTDLVDDSGVDNVHSLYKQKQNYFYTIQSCYSFTKEEMHEMFFMNQACNKLLELIYPMFEEKLTPGNFCKECFAIIKELPEYSKINNYIIDLYDINTPPKSIKKINGRFRTEIIDEMVLNNKHIIISEMFRKWI
jgi:hypothetical protein